MKSGADMEDWEVIPPQKNTFAVRREYLILAVAATIMKGRKVFTKAMRVHRVAKGSATLANRIYWLNCTIAPWCPPKVSIPLSAAMICIFIYNNRK